VQTANMVYRHTHIYLYINTREDLDTHTHTHAHIHTDACMLTRMHMYAHRPLVPASQCHAGRQRLVYLSAHTHTHTRRYTPPPPLIL